MFVNRIIVIFALLWSCSQACSPNEMCFVDLENENIKNLLASMDYFSTQMIQKLYNPQQPPMSLGVISPMSIYVVLVLMLFGSAGNTQKELIDALHFPDADLQELRKSFGDILIATESKRSENSNGKEDVASEGHVAEGIFIHKDFTVVQEYADYLAALNIKTHPVDFLAFDDASKAVYSWIDANSPSKSAAKSYSSNESTRIYLTSLFYLTAKWEDNIFLDKDPGPVPFHTLNDGVIDVPMMKATAPLLYYDNGSSFSAVEVPFAWYDFTAIFILPHTGVDAAKFVTTFTMDILKEFLSGCELKDVDCQIPKMAYSSSVGLNELLQGLGIKELFGEADLSEMLDVQKQNLGVQMAHNNEITVNERGASAEGLSVEPVPKDVPSGTLTPFIADRPFLMLIRSTNSYAIAFATFFYNGSNVSVAVSG